MSASINPTLYPSLPSATARFTATVVFPTPPLPLPTATTCATPGKGCGPCGAPAPICPITSPSSQLKTCSYKIVILRRRRRICFSSSSLLANPSQIPTCRQRSPHLFLPQHLPCPQLPPSPRIFIPSLLMIRLHNQLRHHQALPIQPHRHIGQISRGYMPEPLLPHILHHRL